MAIVCVLGAGRMGTAFCTPLLDRGHEVRLVGTHLDRAYIDALRASGFHPALEHPLPVGATFYQVDKLASAMDNAELLVLGVSSAGVCWATRTLAPLMRPGVPLIMLTKGVAWNGAGFRLLPDLVADGMPEAVRTTLTPVAVTGPCIAGELIRRRETCVVFAGRNPETIKLWADVASTPYYHVWGSTDLAGCEASAALKNAFAVAVGFARGVLERTGDVPSDSPALRGVGNHNYESAVFAEAIEEMAGLVEVVGGKPATAYGLVGIGDLLVTTHARNVRLGRLLGLGLSREAALDEMQGVTLEGLTTVLTLAEALVAMDADGRTKPGEFPLLRHLVAVVNGRSLSVPFDQFFGGRK